MKRVIAKTFVGVIVPVLIAMVALTACGGSSSTTTSSSSGGNGAPAGGAPAGGTPGSGARPAGPVSGTIQQYDSAKQALTVKETNGSTQTITIQKDRILKDQKITQQELSTLLAAKGATVQVLGKAGSDGTYTAQAVIVMSIPSGNAPRAGGTPPAGGAPAGGAPPAAGKGTPPARANGGMGTAPLTLRNSKLQNNKLVGVDRDNKSVTVNISGSTDMVKQSLASESDLTSGQNVSVTALPAASGSKAMGAIVTVGDVPTSMPQQGS